MHSKFTVNSLFDLNVTERGFNQSITFQVFKGRPLSTCFLWALSKIWHPSVSSRFTPFWGGGSTMDTDSNTERHFCLIFRCLM